MSTENPPRELSADISSLRLAVEQLTQQAQSLADYYGKNAGVQECLLFLHKALTCVSDEDELWPDPSIQIDWVSFGKKMKQCRQQAKLGIKELADLADMSESMIRSSREPRKGQAASCSFGCSLYLISTCG